MPTGPVATFDTMLLHYLIVKEYLMSEMQFDENNLPIDPNDTPEQPAPEGETNAQAFKRLVVPRVSTAIKRIQLIGNLSNRSSYEYTEVQVAKIFAALRSELDAAEARFKPKAADKPLFSLDDE